MPGGVDDVDFCTIVNDRYVFGKNGDPSFPFLVITVKDQFSWILIAPEDIGVHDHLVNQRRFSMIDVRYDRYVSDILHL